MFQVKKLIRNTKIKATSASAIDTGIINREGTKFIFTTWYISNPNPINNKIDNVSSLLTAKIGNLRVDVSNLQIEVSTNRNLYYNLEHKYKHLFDTSAVEEFVNNKQSSLQDLIEVTDTKLSSLQDLIEKADSKLSGLQDLIEETDSKLSGLQDYETRISNVEDRISDISSYASANTIRNIETKISSLLEEVENIKQRLNHIDEIKDSSNLPNNTIWDTL